MSVGCRLHCLSFQVPGNHMESGLYQRFRIDLCLSNCRSTCQRGPRSLWAPTTSGPQQKTPSEQPSRPRYVWQYSCIEGGIYNRTCVSPLMSLLDAFFLQSIHETSTCLAAGLAVRGGRGRRRFLRPQDRCQGASALHRLYEPDLWSQQAC